MTTTVAAFDRDEPPPAPKAPPFEVCFFSMSDSFVRMRGGEYGFYGVVRQITYRCGLCGAPVVEDEMQGHFDTHRNHRSEG